MTGGGAMPPEGERAAIESVEAVLRYKRAYLQMREDALRAGDRLDKAEQERDELREMWSESREIVAAATPLLRNVAYLDAAIGDEWIVYCEQVRAVLARIEARGSEADRVS